MDKVFKSTNVQLKILRLRGMIIDNGSRVKKIIEKENYYNLINGYKELFLDPTYNGTDEKYKPSTNFNEIYGLYLFDREIRSLFLKYILELENNIKSVIAHEFSKQYGHDNYLKISNFKNTVAQNSKKTTAKQFGEIVMLIADIQQEIARQLSKNNSMTSHYILNYGYVPLWVLVNSLTLGKINKFYSYMKDSDRASVSKKFNLQSDELQNILFTLSIYRNACAHDERLYNLQTKSNYIHTFPIHNKLSVALKTPNNKIYGKNDLFAVVIIFKIMLPKLSFQKFCTTLKKYIDDLQKQLKVVTMDDVLLHMGFPKDWEIIKKL